MGKIDWRFGLIGFRVRVLIPRFHRRETELQLPENVTILAKCEETRVILKEG